MSKILKQKYEAVTHEQNAIDWSKYIIIQIISIRKKPLKIIIKSSNHYKNIVYFFYDYMYNIIYSLKLIKKVAEY